MSNEDFEDSEFTQMKAQKEAILAKEQERLSKRVFECAVASLKAGAPGLSEASREGIACNIALRFRNADGVSHS